MLHICITIRIVWTLLICRIRGSGSCGIPLAGSRIPDHVFDISYLIDPFLSLEGDIFYPEQQDKENYEFEMERIKLFKRMAQQN